MEICQNPLAAPIGAYIKFLVYPLDEAVIVAMSITKEHCIDIKEVHFLLFADGIYNVWVKMAKELLPNLAKMLALSIMKDAEEKGSITPGKLLFTLRLNKMGLLLNVADATAIVTIIAATPATDTIACSNPPNSPAMEVGEGIDKRAFQNKFESRIRLSVPSYGDVELKGDLRADNKFCLNVVALIMLYTREQNFCEAA
ncbi:hypothetical protein Tco_1105447 [Tanacetum coccineum]